MAKSSYALLILLAAALAWAYTLAHPPKRGPSAGDSAVEVWSLDPADVAFITVQTKKGRAVLTPDPVSEEGAPFVWVETETTKARAKPPPPAKPGQPAPATPPAPVTEKARFKGNAFVENSLESLAHFQARRRIGDLAALDGQMFGLPNDDEYIEVTATGEGDPLRINLGGLTYGNVYRYVHDPRDDTVYLVRASFVENLKPEKRRLLDRRMLSKPTQRRARIELRTRQNTVMLWKLPGGKPGRQRWALDPGETQEDPSLRDWVTALNSLRVDDYLAEGASPTGEPVLEAALFDEGEDEAADSIKLYREGDLWSAISSHTRYAVTVNAHAARKVFDQGGAIVERQ